MPNVIVENEKRYGGRLCVGFKVDIKRFTNKIINPM